MRPCDSANMLETQESKKPILVKESIYVWKEPNIKFWLVVDVFRATFGRSRVPCPRPNHWRSAFLSIRRRSTNLRPRQLTCWKCLWKERHHATSLSFSSRRGSGHLHSSGVPRLHWNPWTWKTNWDGLHDSASGASLLNLWRHPQADVLPSSSFCTETEQVQAYLRYTTIPHLPEQQPLQKRFVEEPPLFCILGMHDLLVYKRGQLFPGIMAIRSWTSGSCWTAEVETNDNPGTSAKRRQTYSQKSGFQTCKWQWIIWLSEKKHITKIHWLTSCILTTSYDGFFRSQTRAS